MDREIKQKVYDKLNELNINYTADEHEAIFTIEELDKKGMYQRGEICKNLFLRDGSGKRHFLVVTPGHKEVDLKKVRAQIGSSRLSFGSAERLMNCLGLTQGSVSPFGVLNDKERRVELVFDKDLVNMDTLGFHPNINTATVWLSFEDMLKVIRDNGNIVHFAEL